MKKSFQLIKILILIHIDPEYKDPFWKAAIKKIIGWQTELEKDAIIENNVLAIIEETFF